MQALLSATRHPAEFLGFGAELGTIEVGKRADLVLLDADPLRDIRSTRRVHAVILGGRLLDSSELDRLLLQATSASAVEQGGERPDPNP